MPVSPVQPREDPRDAVDVSVWVRIGHGVDGEGDVEPVFVRVASSEDSSPMLVAMPAITTCVTPRFFRYSSRPVFVNAPHCRFVAAHNPDGVSRAVMAAESKPESGLCLGFAKNPSHVSIYDILLNLSLTNRVRPDHFPRRLDLQPRETSKKVVRKQISRKLGDVRGVIGEGDHAKSSPSSILISGHASGLIQSLSVWRLYCGATKQCTCLALRSTTQYSRISAAL